LRCRGSAQALHPIDIETRKSRPNETFRPGIVKVWSSLLANRIGTSRRDNQAKSENKKLGATAATTVLHRHRTQQSWKMRVSDSRMGEEFLGIAVKTYALRANIVTQQTYMSSPGRLLTSQFLKACALHCRDIFCACASCAGDMRRATFCLATAEADCAADTLNRM
jgi:hypothetical protein